MLDTIRKQVEWYYENWSNANVDQLLQFQDRLSANLFYVAEEYGKAYNEYVEKYGEYKEAKTQLWLELRHTRAEKTQGEIDKDVENQTIVQFTEQMFADAKIETFKKVLTQGNRLLSAVQQRISWAKVERENTK